MIISDSEEPRQRLKSKLACRPAHIEPQDNVVYKYNFQTIDSRKLGWRPKGSLRQREHRKDEVENSFFKKKPTCQASLTELPVLDLDQTQDVGNATNVTGRKEISDVQRHQPILHQRRCRIALPTRRASICELADVNQELEQDAVEY
jgi:hypothetical protein